MMVQSPVLWNREEAVCWLQEQKVDIILLTINYPAIFVLYEQTWEVEVVEYCTFQSARYVVTEK